MPIIIIVIVLFNTLAPSFLKITQDLGAFSIPLSIIVCVEILGYFI